MGFGNGLENLGEGGQIAVMGGKRKNIQVFPKKERAAKKPGATENRGRTEKGPDEKGKKKRN